MTRILVAIWPRQARSPSAPYAENSCFIVLKRRRQPPQLVLSMQGMYVSPKHRSHTRLQLHSCIFPSDPSKSAGLLQNSFMSLLFKNSTTMLTVRRCVLPPYSAMFRSASSLFNGLLLCSGYAFRVLNSR